MLVEGEQYVITQKTKVMLIENGFLKRLLCIEKWKQVGRMKQVLYSSGRGLLVYYQFIISETYATLITSTGYH